MIIRHPVIAVTGLSFEALIASGPGVVALCSSDRHQLDNAISIEVLRGCRGIVTFGIAGGLCPNLAPGTCVVACSIVTPQERFATDGAWSRHLLRSIPGAVHADIAGGHELISDPATKRSLGDATGAVAVDAKECAIIAARRLCLCQPQLVAGNLNPASSISNANSDESRPDATAPAFQVGQS